MKNITNNIKKALVGLGIFILPYIPLKSQESNTLVKAGITYNLVQTEEISKNCFGIESLAEKGFFSRITGATIGGITDFAKSGSGALVFVVLIVAAGGFVLFRVYKLRKR